VSGKGQAEETPIGFVPTKHALTLDGLKISPESIEELLRVDAGDWQKEADEIGSYFKKFGDRLPPELRAEQTQLSERLNLVASAKG